MPFVFIGVMPGCEDGGFVDSEDGRVPWCVYFCFDAAALDGVLHAVEGEFAAEELEELVGCGAGDVGLEVEEV